MSFMAMMGTLQQQEAGVLSGGDLNGGLGMTQMLLQQAMMINGMTVPVIAVAAGMWWRWQRAVVMSKSKLRGSSGFPLLGETMAYMSQMGSPLANFVDNKAKRLHVCLCVQHMLKNSECERSGFRYLC